MNAPLPIGPQPVDGGIGISWSIINGKSSFGWFYKFENGDNLECNKIIGVPKWRMQKAVADTDYTRKWQLSPRNKANALNEVDYYIGNAFTLEMTEAKTSRQTKALFFSWYPIQGVSLGFGLNEGKSVFRLRCSF